MVRMNAYAQVSVRHPSVLARPAAYKRSIGLGLSFEATAHPLHSTKVCPPLPKTNDRSTTTPCGWQLAFSASDPPCEESGKNGDDESKGAIKFRDSSACKSHLSSSLQLLDK